MCAQIVFQSCFGVAKGHIVLLEQCVHLEAGRELEQPADLCLGQRTGPVPLDGNRLERPSRDIVPSVLERRRDILW